MNIARVDWSQPINWESPLNRGLKGCWIAVPSRMGWGTNRWVDACSPNAGNHGTLNSMDPATDWVGDSPNGLGSLYFDGTDPNSSSSAWVNFSNGSNILTGTGSFSVYAFANAEVINNYRSVLGGARTDPSLPGSFYLQFRPDTNKWAFIVKNNTGTEYKCDGSTTSTGWHGLCGTFDSGTGEVQFWLDGERNGTAATLSGTRDVIADMYIGAAQYVGNVVNRWPGWIQSAFAFDRVLTESENALLYQESLQSYPTLLNYQPVRRYVFVDAGGAIAAALQAAASVGGTQSVMASLRSTVLAATDAGESQSVMASLQSALTAATDAGESWAGAISLEADMSEGATLLDSSAVEAALQSSLSAGTDAGFVFGGTLLGAATLSEAVSATDAESAVADLLATMSEAVDAGDTWAGSVAAVGAVTGALTAGADVGDSYSVTMAGLATLSASAGAGEAQTNTLAGLADISEGTGAGESLTTGTTVPAALQADADLGESLSVSAVLRDTLSESVDFGDSWVSSLVGLAVYSEGASLDATFANVASLIVSVTDGGEFTGTFIEASQIDLGDMNPLYSAYFHSRIVGLAVWREVS